MKKTCGDCNDRMIDSDNEHYVCIDGDKSGNKKRVREDQKACKKFIN